MFCYANGNLINVKYLDDMNNETRKQPMEVFCKNSVLKNFTKFTGKRMC